MGPGDTSEGQCQNSACYHHGGGQLPAPRALECSEDGARGEYATTINSKDFSNQSVGAVFEEEEEVRRQK